MVSHVAVAVPNVLLLVSSLPLCPKLFDRVSPCFFGELLASLFPACLLDCFFFQVCCMILLFTKPPACYRLPQPS